MFSLFKLKFSATGNERGLVEDGGHDFGFFFSWSQWGGGWTKRWHLAFMIFFDGDGGGSL